jgi:hypothetical protein
MLPHPFQFNIMQSFYVIYSEMNYKYDSSVSTVTRCGMEIRYSVPDEGIFLILQDYTSGPESRRCSVEFGSLTHEVKAAGA